MHEDPRMIILEEKIAYLEQHIGELDGVIRGLADQLAKQGKGVEAVRGMIEKHLAGDNDAASDPAVDDRPPHW